MFKKLFSYCQKFLFSSKIIKEDNFIPIGIIFAIACYIPFEGLITTWLPGIVRAILRVIPELVIYFLLFRVSYLRISLGLKLRKTLIDPLIAAFFLCCTISTLANQASFFSSFNYLRESWRYVAIYYIIVNINIPRNRIGTLLDYIKNIGIFQGILASVQFFLPASVKVAMAGGGCDKALNKGASCGSFIDSATLAGFLLISITILIACLVRDRQLQLHKPRNLAVIGLTFFGLFASKKRAALILVGFVPAFILFLLNRKKMFINYIWIAISLATVILFIVPILVESSNLVTQESSAVQTDISSYFLRVFSAEYWDEFFLNARGWFISLTSQTLSKTGSWWFGLSPDLSTVVEKMSAVLSKGSDITKLKRDRFVFQDVYWFSQLAFYGLAGIAIYWSILWRLFQTSWNLVKTTKLSEYRYLGTVSCTVVVISFLYSFAERLFVLRTFSYYFWLFAGLVGNAQYINKASLRLKNVSPSAKGDL